MSESLFFITLPKSGTDFTWNTLEDITDLKMPSPLKDPTLMKIWESGLDNEMEFATSTGDFTSQRLIAKGMKHYLPNGYVFGTHMQASYHNIKVLEQSGIKKITVLIRDPRDVVISWTHHVKKSGPDHRKHISKFYHLPPEYYTWDLSQQLSYQVRTFLPLAVNWIESWLSYYSDPDRKMDILFVFFDELKRSPEEYFKKITSFHLCESVNLSKIKKPVWGTRHFRKGEYDQWKNDFSDDDLLFSKLLIGQRLKNAFKKAILSHKNFLNGLEYFHNQEYLQAAKCMLSVINQFPMSKEVYDLLINILKMINIQKNSGIILDKNEIKKEFNQLTEYEDCLFIYDYNYINYINELCKSIQYGINSCFAASEKS
ncbi:Sulfotransferase domain-containing protein [Candidatus Magnetomoraceae bacterium gMMP-1]